VANPQDGDAALLFRPEDVGVVEATDAAFIGTVISAFFSGNRTRLIPDGIVAEPVVVESPPHQVFAVGAAVPVRIRRDGLMTLPNPAERG
jgi:putative spermidine/putrescine transport system ATP-binding protein